MKPCPRLSASWSGKVSLFCGAGRAYYFVNHQVREPLFAFLNLSLDFSSITFVHFYLHHLVHLYTHLVLIACVCIVGLGLVWVSESCVWLRGNGDDYDV